MVRPDHNFSGVNQKCTNCQGECKQWEQVKVVVCPNFKPLDLSTGKLNEDCLQGTQIGK